MEKIRIRDPGWKKVGFVIRNPVKHTESATLVTIAAGGISTATFPSPQPALHINNNVSQYKYWYAPNSHCCCHKSTTVALPSQQQLHTTVTVWRPHNSNLQGSRKKLQAGTVLFLSSKFCRRLTTVGNFRGTRILVMVPAIRCI